MSKTVAVVFGGKSNEHEVSIITGTMAANVLKSGEYTVIPLYITAQNEIYTGAELADINVYKTDKYKKFNRAFVAKGGIFIANQRLKIKRFVKIDVALNCCHGGYGEGGGVCGLFALNDIPLAGAGIFESAAFMDKYYTKLVLSSLGVKTLPYIYVRHNTSLKDAEKLGYPLIVKPAKLGSSIGVEKVTNREELENALFNAFLFDDGVICERYIEGRREINCAAYYTQGNVVTSECEEPKTEGDIFSYDDKYTGDMQSTFPADLPPATARFIKKTTADVYRRLNVRGIVRFDYILNGDEVYLSEINTVPGSLSYYLLSNGFKEFYAVLNTVINQAMEDFALLSKKKIITTGILKNVQRGSKGRK